MKKLKIHTYSLAIWRLDTDHFWIIYTYIFYISLPHVSPLPRPPGPANIHQSLRVSFFMFKYTFNLRELHIYVSRLSAAALPDKVSQRIKKNSFLFTGKSGGSFSKSTDCSELKICLRVDKRPDCTGKSHICKKCPRTVCVDKAWPIYTEYDLWNTQYKQSVKFDVEKQILFACWFVSYTLAEVPAIPGIWFKLLLFQRPEREAEEKEGTSEADRFKVK